MASVEDKLRWERSIIWGLRGNWFAEIEAWSLIRERRPPAPQQLTANILRHCIQDHQSAVHFLAILDTFYSLLSLLMVTGEEYHDWSHAPRWNVNVATVCPHCPQATRDHTGAGGTFSHNFTLGLSPEWLIMSCNICNKQLSKVYT